MIKVSLRGIFLLSIFALISIGIAPTLWQIYLWSSFPEYNVQRFGEIQKKNGLGQECSYRNVSGSKPDIDDVRTCFKHGNFIENKIFASAQAGSEMSILSYGCQSDKFYAESYYISYSTSEYYQCVYRTSEKKEDIQKVGDVEIDAYSLYPPNFVTKFLLKAFSAKSG